MEKTVLIIAGSDPTGGAGLQADIKTMTAVGVYSAAVVTCITVQNSNGVKRIEKLDPELVKEQIDAVLIDHNVTHVKLGMVGDAEIAEAINGALANYSGELVVDPVLVSTTGQELLQASDLDAIKLNLISRATVLTPNLPELASITGLEVNDPESALNAADRLLSDFQNLRSVVVKGGHMENDLEVTDLLLYRSSGATKLVSSTRPFVHTRNTHGTGCALASAYTAFHCITGDDETAFFNSAGFIQQQLELSSATEIVKNPEGRGGLLYRTSDERS